MLKGLAGFVLGIVFTGLVGFVAMPSLMFNEMESPFDVEETAARVQQNIIRIAPDTGWALSGLRDPAKAVRQSGGNTLPVLMVEACSTKYSGPILKDDDRRYLSILMPCKISVYKKNDGKTYIGTMNAGLMGKFFGANVAGIMTQVARDQKEFVKFNPNDPAPALILPQTGGAGGGAGGGASGC